MVRGLKCLRLPAHLATGLRVPEFLQLNGILPSIEKILS